MINAINRNDNFFNNSIKCLKKTDALVIYQPDSCNIYVMPGGSWIKIDAGFLCYALRKTAETNTWHYNCKNLFYIISFKYFQSTEQNKNLRCFWFYILAEQLVKFVEIFLYLNMG